MFLKRGEQNWPVHPDHEDYYARQYTGHADYWKSINDERAAGDRERLAWDGILLEEVYEALGEVDPGKQRAELIQAAAMCIATIEALDRAND